MSQLISYLNVSNIISSPCHVDITWIFSALVTYPDHDRHISQAYVLRYIKYDITTHWYCVWYPSHMFWDLYYFVAWGNQRHIILYDYDIAQNHIQYHAWYQEPSSFISQENTRPTPAVSARWFELQYFFNTHNIQNSKVIKVINNNQETYWLDYTQWLFKTEERTLKWW